MLRQDTCLTYRVSDFVEPDELSITQEEKWRSDILPIVLRINGKDYPDIFNRCLDLDFNLALYLVKYMKKAPE